ncbi:MAG: hypothetical protein RR415_05765 [Ruthenibacterium sp.]
MATMEKEQWYDVSFRAKLDEEDVRAMKSCFFQAMEEAMNITECADLDLMLVRKEV